MFEEWVAGGQSLTEQRAVGGPALLWAAAPQTGDEGQATGCSGAGLGIWGQFGGLGEGEGGHVSVGRSGG